jgi:hypothetical protein
MVAFENMAYLLLPIQPMTTVKAKAIRMTTTSSIAIFLWL